MVLHLPTFGPTGGPKAAGFSLSGTANETELLRFGSGVVFDSVGDSTDPLAGVALAFDAGIQFPLDAVGGSGRVAVDESDVEGPIAAATC